MDYRHVDHVPSIFSIGLSLFFVWLLLFFALVRSNVTLAVPSAAVLTVMYGTRLWTRVATMRLELVLTPDRIRLFPDEQVRVTATLYNRKPLPVWVRVSRCMARVQAT